MSDETTKRTCPQCQAELPADSPEGLCPACLLKAGAVTSGTSISQATTGDVAPPPVSATPAQGPSFIPPTTESLAPHFPQLEILELLGQGGMGAVYRARQKHLDRVVALKILPGELSLDPAFTERFAREARALARLNHPNVINVFDYGQAGGHFFILMEYVDGANLREVQRTGRLSPAQALAIVPQLCEALQYAHDEGVVHRDIKPENILFDRKGRVKIADFGLAKLAARTTSETVLTGSNQIVGTWQYMAPEQVEHSREVDHRADIYSMGVVLYEMLTGELPLGRFEPPSRKIQLDVRLDEVVLKTLEKDPARRYQQAEDVKTDVERITAKPAPAAPPQASGEKPAEKDKAAVKIDFSGIRAGDVEVGWDGVRVSGPERKVSVGWDGVNVKEQAGSEVDPQRIQHHLAFYGVGLIVEGVALVVYVVALLGRGPTWAEMPYNAAMLLAGPAIICGAIQMLTLRSLTWSYVATILSLIAIPFWYAQTWWLVWIPIALFNFAALSSLGGRKTQEAFLTVRQREGKAGWIWVIALLAALGVVVFIGGAVVLLYFMSASRPMPQQPRATVTSALIPATFPVIPVRETVQRFPTQMARLKGYFGTTQPPPDLSKTLEDAERCVTDLYALTLGDAEAPLAEAMPNMEVSSHAKRARDLLHRLQLALGVLESRGTQGLPQASIESWKKDLDELQRNAAALEKRAEEIGAIEAEPFAELCRQLSDEFNTLRNVEHIQDAARRYRFTSRQADELLGEFDNTGQSQTRVVEILLPRLTDSENAARLWARIPLQSERDRIRKEWESRGGATKPDAGPWNTEKPLESHR